MRAYPELDHLCPRAAPGHLDELLAFMMAGVHHGRPGRPAAIKRQVADLLARGRDVDSRRSLALELAGRPEYVARELACALLPPELGRAEAEPWIRRLADDPDWEVRESAAGLLYRFARGPQGLALLGAFCGEESVHLRRAAALATRSLALERRPELAEPLLDLLEPLLADTRRYLRLNLGPFTLGDGLLRAYPQATLKRLRAWASRPDAGTRWNVATALGAAEGARHLTPALEILEILAADPRPFVGRAVASTLRKLARRCPERLTPVLEA
ncbi:MAG TPA: HEAT repeat domain-containing protein, partial [Candidatus Nitrosotenuis sp.]|nr:HEAT repeat domain-containing protein [Candidatus Nitrosotenuis sp.]